MEQLLRLDLEDGEGANVPPPSTEPFTRPSTDPSQGGEGDGLEGLNGLKGSEAGAGGAGGAGSGGFGVGGGGGGDGGGGFRAVSFSKIWEMVGSFKHRLCKKGLKGRVREGERERDDLYKL